MNTKKPKTHFEQVPMEEVAKLLRKIAAETDKAKPNPAGNVIVERPGTKTEPYSVGRAV